MSYEGFETLAIHAGQEPDPRPGRWSCPSTRPRPTSRTGSAGCAAATSTAAPANPTRTALEECLAALEGGARGLAFASGLAAEDTLLRTVCAPGDHVVIPDDAYGGTLPAVRQGLRAVGRELRRRSHLSDLDAVRAAIRRTTKVVWVETPTNPLLGIADIAALGRHRARPRARCWWSTTRSPRRTCSGRSRSARTWSCTRPPSTSAATPTWSAARWCVADAELAERLALPPERDGRGAGAVRLLAGAARHQDARRADGPALRQRRAGRRAARRPPGRRRGALPGPARRTPATRWRPSRCAGSAAWCRSGWRGGEAAALRVCDADQGVHARRVARRGRVADRAPGPDDARLGGRARRWRCRPTWSGSRSASRPSTTSLADLLQALEP